MWITEFLAWYITAFIWATWYISVFVLMTMESMIFPVPSEAVMPFAWFLVADWRFNLIVTIIASILWSVAWSLISYYIWYYWWNKFIKKYGKYFLVDEEELLFTEKLFAKRGQIIVFFGRMIPVIRHFISIPAWIGKMNLKKFLIYTIIGAWIWNTFLTIVWFYLQKKWDTIMKYSEVLDIAIVVILALVIWMFIYKIIKKKIKIKNKKKDAITD